MSVDIIKSRPLHKVLNTTVGLLKMQCAEGPLNDVAIPYWRGAPGIGKTAMCSLFKTKYNMNLLETHFGQTPIEDVSGLPNFHDITVNGTVVKGTKWTLPEVLTQLWEIYESDPNPVESKKTIVWLLDDFHLAPASMMALGFEMFTKFTLRGQALPPKTSFLLAGNMSAKAGSKKNLLSAVANRCVILPVHGDFNHWKTEFAIPVGINSKVITFLSNSKYNKYFQEEEQLENPWASARSWTKFANLLSMQEEFMPDLEHTDIMYFGAGHVGEEAASEFATYHKIYSQVETDKIFDKKIPIEIPDSFSGQYIFALANVNEFIDRFKKAKSNMRGEIVEIMTEIIIELAKSVPSIAVTAMKDIILLENSLKLKNVYSRIKSSIAIINPAINTKLEEDINKL